MENSIDQNSTDFSDDRKSARSFRLPQVQIGLGSTEAELINLIRKYLEIVGLVVFVWILGYFHFSVSWILLAVFIYLFRQRQRILFKERHKMIEQINNNEENYVKARLDELPSWVFFPDVERAEWLNRIIKQAWPYANKYLDKSVFREVLIPIIQGTSVALSDFSFEKLDLGEIPPKIGGVKVYTENVRDQIMMDVEVFYAGDARIKTKVKGIVCGIKDIQFVGDLRIILSPLINTIPLFGAVTYFFLRKPSIDFKLTDAGTLVDIPGLNDLMLVQINDIVSSMMVLPNRQVFPLVTDLQIGHLKWSNPQGVVRVLVQKARDLIKADLTLLGKGKSDPFVRVKAQGNAEYKTKVLNNTTEPEWNEVFEFVVEQSESDSVSFEVFDEDPGKDDFLGRAQYPIDTLRGRGLIDTWLTLRDVKKGSLNVCLQYFSLTTNKEALEIIERNNAQIPKFERLSKALLIVFVDRCLNLPRSRKTQREPNPYCRISVDSQKFRTQTLESQTNPQFEYVAQMLLSNPLQQKLTIDICDGRSNDTVIAFYEMPIKQIFEEQTMTIETRSFSLKSGSEQAENARIVLRLALWILQPSRETTPTTPNSSSSFESSFRASLTSSGVSTPTSIKTTSISTNSAVSTPIEQTKTFVVSNDPDLVSTPFGLIKIGVRYAVNRKSLSVKVFNCKNLMKVHQQNLPDPYVRLLLLPDSKKDKKKTRSIRDTLNPNYDDLFEWTGSLADIHRQKLIITIKNDSPLFAKEQTYMGELHIDLANLDPEKNSVAWYALQEPNTSAVTAQKIKYDQDQQLQVDNSNDLECLI